MKWLHLKQFPTNVQQKKPQNVIQTEKLESTHPLRQQQKNKLKNCQWQFKTTQRQYKTSQTQLKTTQKQIKHPNPDRKLKQQIRNKMQ